MAIRYPRGSFYDCSDFESTPFIYGKAQVLQEGSSDILLLGYGNGVGKAIECSHILKEDGLDVGIVDLRFAKPLDEELLVELSKQYTKWFVLSDSAKIGGIGSLMLSVKEKNDLHVRIMSFEYDDNFITHGATPLIEEKLGISAQQISLLIKNIS